jgi:hypothetical protein
MQARNGGIAVKWIMIAWILGVGVTTGEFDDELACNHALMQVTLMSTLVKELPEGEVGATGTCVSKGSPPRVSSSSPPRKQEPFDFDEALDKALEQNQ